MAIIKLKRGTEAALDTHAFEDYEIGFTTDTKKIIIYDGVNRKKYLASDAITSAAISDWTEAVQDVVGSLISDGTTIDGTYSDENGTFTLEVKDNSITLAKMEHGTQGDLIYYAVDGAPTRLSFGTAGQALITAGEGANPAWGAVAEGKVTFADTGGHTHTGADGKGTAVVWGSIDKTTSSIADITTKSHTSLSDIGNNTHGDIDTFIGTTVPAFFNTSNGHDHDGSDSKKVSYADLASIPSTFAPASHTIEGHTATVTAGKILTGTGENTFGWADPAPTWGQVSSKPSTFAAILGTGATDACAGNDSRLSDARTPVSHTIEGHTATVTDGQILVGTGSNTFGWGGVADFSAGTFVASTSWGFAGNSTVSITNAAAKQLRLGYDGSNYTDFQTDSSGNSYITNTGGQYEISSVVNYCPQFKLTANQTTSNGGYLFFQRSRSSSTSVQSGDWLGNVGFRGYQNSGWRDCASVIALVDGAPSGNYVPGALSFFLGSTSAAPTERMVLNNYGLSLPYNNYRYGPLFTIASEYDGATSANMYFTKKHGTGAVQSYDDLGFIYWSGYANGAMRESACFGVTTEGAPSGDNVPCYFDFWTSDESGIDSTFWVAPYGVGPTTGSTIDCGAASQQWDNVYCVNLAESSDANKKENIIDIPLGLDFISRLRPRQYKFKDRVVESKRENKKTGEKTQKTITYTRKHTGLIAQEVKQVLDDLEISTTDFAAYIDGGEGGLSLRYTEFIAPIIRAIQELTARVEALESA